MMRIVQGNRLRTTAIGLGVVVSVLVLISLTMVSGQDESINERGIWDLLGTSAGVSASEAVAYRSIDDVEALSDAVIVGEVISTKVRTELVPEDEDSVEYLRLRVRVKEF